MAGDLEEDAAALPPVQADLVQQVGLIAILSSHIAPSSQQLNPGEHAQFMGPAVMCSFERRRDRIREAMQAFQRFPGDTGSSEVQGELSAVSGGVFIVKGPHVIADQGSFGQRSGHLDGEDPAHGGAHEGAPQGLFLSQVSGPPRDTNCLSWRARHTGGHVLCGGPKRLRACMTGSVRVPRSGLRGMLSQRRKLLQYLRRTDFDAYAGMLSKLGLKDTYAKQVAP